MTGAELINEARDAHPSFVLQRISQTMARNRLSAKQRSIYREVTLISEDALATPLSFAAVAIAAALAARTGLALPAGTISVLADLDCTLSTQDAPVKCDLLSYANRFTVDRFPSVYYAGGRLFPIDLRDYSEALSGWDDVTALRLLAVQPPTALTSVADTITLSDLARDALVSDLVVYMAGRCNVLPELRHKIEEAQAAHAQTVSALAGMGNAAHWRVVDR